MNNDGLKTECIQCALNIFKHFQQPAFVELNNEEI